MVTATTIAALHWLAFGGIAGTTATDRFEPSMTQELVGFQDVDFDSGWIPGDSPVQLRFYAHAADSVVIEMLGDGIYDWDAETIAFEGDPMAGWFSIDVGLELQASVRFDVAGFQWESDILGPWDYAIIAEALFTPYLLPGHPDSPVEIDDQTDGVPVASVPIVPDILIASGNLDIDVAADITASLEGLRIEALTEGDEALVDAHQVPSPLTPAPGEDPLAVDGVLVAGVQTSPTLIVRPHLVMSILGQDFEIVGIDIPVELPPTDDVLEFEPEPMLFEAPEPPPAPPTTGDEGSGGGDGGGDGSVADDTGAADGGTAGGESGTETDGAPECCDEVEGCGCRSGRAPNGLALGLVLLMLGLVPRRRRR